MKTFAVLFTTLALVIQFGGYAAAQQPQDAQEAPPPTGTRIVEAPTFKVGDFWEYRRSQKGDQFTRTVTAIKGDLVTMVDEAGQKFVFSKDGNIVEGYDLGELAQTYDPFIPRLQFPLQERKNWARSFTVRSQRRVKPHNATVWGKVGGWEQISVPAGNFNAIKIEIQFQGFGQGRQEVCWYAQEIKRFVKCTFSEAHRGNDFELVSYRVQ